MNLSLIYSSAIILDPIAQQVLNLSLSLTGNAGSFNINTPNLTTTDGAKVTVRNDGTGNTGNLNINADDILVDQGVGITASTELGDEDNIDVTTQGLFISSNSLVSASSEFGLDGEINIDNFNGDHFLEFNQSPDNFLDETKEIITSCDVGDNQFAIAGQGGLPENPGQYLRGQTLWQDLRILSDNPNQITNNPDIPKDSQKPTILEAQTWKINQQGNVELLAHLPVSERHDFGQSNHKCLH
ncbi:MAG: hypothetical protein AAGA80_24600 [Cyanobacteria bacterium P01_F01_bin.143]